MQYPSLGAVLAPHNPQPDQPRRNVQVRPRHRAAQQERPAALREPRIHLRQPVLELGPLRDARGALRYDVLELLPERRLARAPEVRLARGVERRARRREDELEHGAERAVHERAVEDRLQAVGVVREHARRVRECLLQVLYDRERVGDVYA